MTLPPVPALPPGRRYGRLAALLAVTVAGSLLVAALPGAGPARGATRAKKASGTSVVEPALRGTATASSSADGAHGPAKALDGDPATSWQAAPGDAKPWLQVDLGEPVWLTGVRQLFATTDLWRFSVKGSLDEKTWVTLLDRDAGAQGHAFAESASGAYRYVRLVARGDEHPVSSRELTLSGSRHGRDVAYGKAATASGAQDGYGAEQAVDASTSTSWSAVDGPGPQWLQVDLGSATQVTGVTQTFAAHDTWKFRIEGSLDGDGWTPLLDASRGRAGHVFGTTADGLYRYVRLTVTGSAQGHRAGSTGLQVFGYDDLARTGTATAVDQSPNCLAAYAIDGDDTTSWCADGSAVPKWLQVDLGGRAALTRVRQAFHDEDTYAFQIRGSLDGKTWTTLVDRSTASKGRVYDAKVSGTYRYVRLVVLSSNGRWANSDSLQVLGLPLERDLARGTATTSSSNVTGHDPGMAVDGDPATSWDADTAKTPNRLTVDLGHLSAVTRIEPTFAAPDAWAFRLDGSADGRSWHELASHRGGALATTYSDDVSGSYRYVRLTVTGTRDHRWTSVAGLKVVGTGSPVTSTWWESTGPVKRFFPKQYGLRWTAITGQLEELRAQGYQALELAGFKQGPVAEYAGLGATDNFRAAPELGTQNQFQTLIDTAHALGMRVVLFENLGYTHVSAPFFKQALRDFKAGRQSKERSWFVLAKKQPSQERWYQDKATGVWYYAFWGQDLPTYNWAKQPWRDEAARILRFWAEKGADGFGLDAPLAYWGFDQDLNNRYVTSTLRNYDVSAMAEGLPTTYDGKTQDWYRRIVRDWHYTTVQDLSINFWGDPSQNKLVPAMVKQDPSGLDAAFRASRDAVTAAGGAQVEAPGWEADLTDGKPDPKKVVPASQRLLEIATLTSAGSLFYVTNGYHLYRPEEQTIAHWTDAQREQLYATMRAQTGDKSLDPGGSRVQVPTGDDRKYYAYVRTDQAGGVRSLVVLNYQKTRQTVRVDLTGAGIATGQTPVDLVSGKVAPRIGGTSYELTLPGYGYAQLAVR